MAFVNYATTPLAPTFFSLARRAKLAAVFNFNLNARNFNFGPLYFDFGAGYLAACYKYHRCANN